MSEANALDVMNKRAFRVVAVYIGKHFEKWNVSKPLTKP